MATILDPTGDPLLDPSGDPLTIGATFLEELNARTPTFGWPLNEAVGLTAVDATTGGTNGTYTSSGVSYTTGAVGPFVGVDLVAPGYVEAAVTMVKPFTMGVWVNRHGHQAGQTAEINSLIGDLISSSNGVLLRFTGDTDTLTAYIATGGGYATVTGTITTGDDHFVVLTCRADNTIALYIDATEVGNTTNSIAGFTGNWKVGRSEEGRYIDAAVAWAFVLEESVELADVEAMWAAALAPPSPPELTAGHLELHGGTLVVAEPPALPVMLGGHLQIHGGFLDARQPLLMAAGHLVVHGGQLEPVVEVAELVAHPDVPVGVGRYPIGSRSGP